MSKVKLGDVFPLIRNGASIKQFDGATGFPITRIETIAERVVDRKKFGYADIEDVDKYESYILQDEDILMSHINSEKHLGKTALYKKQENEIIIHGMNLLLLRADKKIVIPRYAFYFLNSSAFYIQIPQITKKSVNQASFTVTALKNLNINLYSFPEQQQIADNLDKVSDLIKKRKQQLEKLDLLIKSHFVEMFGDPVVNEKNWEIASISDISNYIKSGLSRKLSDEDIGIPVIRSTNIINGKLENEPIKYWYLDDPQGANTRDYFLKENDVLVNFINSEAHIGKTCIYHNIGRSCIYTTNIFVMRLNEKCVPIYYNYFAMTEYYKRQLRKIVQPAVNQASFTTSNFKTLKLPLPPLELQNQFADFVTATEQQKEKIKKSLETLETLKASLMQKYFG